MSQPTGPKPWSTGGLLRTLLQLSSWHLYHGFALAYDMVALAVSLGRWFAWVEAALPFIVGPRVLEIGHGTGHLLYAIATGQKIWVFGLDESLQMGRLAQQRVRASDLHRVNLARGLAQVQPFRSASFDTVVSTFPTQFMFHRETLTEICRVLAPNGRLIVTPAAWVTGKRTMERVSTWLFRATRQVPASAEQMIDERLIQPLQQAGLAVSLHRLEVRSSVVLLVSATKAETIATSAPPPTHL